MTELKTISVKSPDLWEKAQEICKREGISMSALICKNLEEYIKVHGEGNPIYSLDKWSNDPEFKAVPAFLESNEKWISFIKNVDDETLVEIERKAHIVGTITKCYLRIGDKEKRKNRSFLSIRDMESYANSRF